MPFFRIPIPLLFQIPQSRNPAILGQSRHPAQFFGGNPDPAFFPIPQSRPIFALVPPSRTDPAQKRPNLAIPALEPPLFALLVAHYENLDCATIFMKFLLGYTCITAIRDFLGGDIARRIKNCTMSTLDTSRDSFFPMFVQFVVHSPPLVAFFYLIFWE